MNMGTDAIWIMDDDTIPKEDALQKLWEGMAHVRKQMAPKSEIGFVSSTVLWTDGSPCEMNRQHYVGDAFITSGQKSAGNLETVELQLQNDYFFYHFCSHGKQ